MRRNELRASQVMQDRVMANLELKFSGSIRRMDYSVKMVSKVHLLKKKGTPEEEKVDIKIAGFFLAIGHKPNTDFLSGQIDLDKQGYIR